MKKVLTVGVFDYFHYGHLKLFERAKECGDYLIVAVQNGDYILKFKPQAKVLYSTEQRLEMINSLKVVDEVITYNIVGEDIKKIDFDVFVRGEDQTNDSFVEAEKYVRSIGKEVIVLPRTKGISSTEIKEALKSN